MAHYLSDSDLTDQLPSLANAIKLDTEAERTSKCRTPAAAIVDGWFSDLAPFADITATPATPDLIKTGAIQVAAALAFEVLSGTKEDANAKRAWETAKMIFQISEDGRAGVLVPGVDTAERFIVVDVTRSILDEDRDATANRDALYP